MAEGAKRRLKTQRCPPLPPLANTPRPLRELCWVFCLCWSHCSCPSCDTPAVMFQPQLCPPGPSGFYSNLLAWGSSACHPSTSCEGERRQKPKKEWMKSQSKRKKNTHLAMPGDLKCPYKQQTFCSVSVRAGRTGDGKKGETKKVLTLKIHFKEAREGGSEPGCSASLSCAYHSV